MTTAHRNSNGDNVSPTVTLSLFGYSGRERAWAFAQMGLARPRVDGTPGLRFWRLVGSGRGAGFSLSPDWSRYGLLAVWERPSDADAFLGSSTFIDAVRAHADEVWTTRLTPVAAHGAWSGVNPFLPLAQKPDGGPVAVITRASVRWRRLGAFWGAVPSASRAIEQAGGLLVSIGIGEAPFVRQATFSVWRDDASMRAFAYDDPAHREAIRRTREERWYAEDLFARFVPTASEGSWRGHDPLAGLL
jgi:hypothetical protein